MATLPIDTAPPADRTPTALWAGRALSGLAILFLLMDAGGKLIAPAAMIANSPPIGWPNDTNVYRMLGAILLVPTLLYIWPRTAVLGAILLTGYLGGAVATHARIDSPLFTHTLFGVYIGLIVWGGLYLRSPALRALLR